MLYLLGINRYDPKDTAPRVIEALQNSSIIFGEHEEAAKSFMDMVGIDYSNKDIYEVTAQNEHLYARWAVDQVRSGKSISYLTGDGYPVITDPGYRIVNTFIKNGEGIRVYPQVSAIISSMILSGYLGATNETFFYGGMLDFMSDKMKLEAMASSSTAAVYLYQRTRPSLKHLEDIYGVQRDVAICIDMGHDTQRIIYTKIGLLFHSPIPEDAIYVTFVISPRDREIFFNTKKMPNNEVGNNTLKEIGIQQNTNYIHNTANFRCDEFTKDHNGKLHLLFSGCSNTWPQAIDEDMGWAKRTYNKLSEIYNVSGYYNLGIPGASISEICQNVMSYCQIYGKPNIIFLNLPDAMREARKVGQTDHTEEYTDDEKREYADLEYKKLEGYCKVNKIFLITFSWTDGITTHGGNIIQRMVDFFAGKDHGKTFSISRDFQTYIEINKKKFQEYVLEYFKNNPNDPDADVARDSDHPGHAVHWAWYNFVYETFKSNPWYAENIEGYKKIPQSD